MIKKTLGYILSLAGLAGIALTFETVTKALKVTLPAQLTPTYLTIGSIVLILIGIFLIVKSPSGKRQEAEVPIYHGKEIIGYRRH